MHPMVMQTWSPNNIFQPLRSHQGFQSHTKGCKAYSYGPDLQGVYQNWITTVQNKKRRPVKLGYHKIDHYLRPLTSCTLACVKFDKAFMIMYGVAIRHSPRIRMDTKYQPFNLMDCFTLLGKFGSCWLHRLSTILSAWTAASSAWTAVLSAVRERCWRHL